MEAGISALTIAQRLQSAAERAAAVRNAAKQAANEVYANARKAREQAQAQAKGGK